MLRKIILTYYYVFFQAHSRSKYAKQFTSAWQQVFIQISVSLSTFILGIVICFENIFNKRFFPHIEKFSFIILFGILPGVILYQLLFNVYKISKENDDHNKVGIIITKPIRIIAWFFYVFSILFPILALFIRRYISLKD